MDQENKEYLKEQIKLLKQEKEDLEKNHDIVSGKLKEYQEMFDVLNNKELVGNIITFLQEIKWQP